MKKILFVGNSFSQNATRFIEDIAGGELFVRNLYIGGCSLETHVERMKDGAAAYEYQKDGVSTGNCSLDKGLEAEDWDVVSVQQVSSDSGVIESYEPYITELINHIREKVPRAEIVFHRTWSYEEGSHHPAFAKYGSSRERMYEMISTATRQIAAKHSLPVIPSGVAIEMARGLPEFDLERAGAPITADTFHLGRTGEYLAGLVLYRFFTGRSATTADFVPEWLNADLYRRLAEIADRA